MSKVKAPAIVRHSLPSWDAICTQLAKLVNDEPPGVLEMDLLVVDSPGHARHLSQRLATHPDGPQISAGFTTITWDQLRSSLNNRHILDKWQGISLEFAIINVIRTSTDPRMQILQAQLINHPGRAIFLGRRLARIFTGYLRNYPELLQGWSAGEDFDFASHKLADRDAWQPVLWRELVELLGNDPTAEETEPADLSELPARIIAISMAAPSISEMAVLQRLAETRQVHLFTHQPVSVGPGNPLVHWLNHRELSTAAQELSEKDSWLAEVQNSIRSNSALSSPRHDDSIQLHACHGPDRQVEVLREVLTGLFTDDPTLQPRDVLVICPDLPRYAPLVAAAFSPGGEVEQHPGKRLRVQVAARSIPRFNPVIGVLEALLALRHGRATSEDLLAFCQLAPVSRLFSFDAEDRQDITNLISASQIRWGIDKAQRARNGVSIESSTWIHGLERMLVSIALDTTPPVLLETATPLANFDEGNAQLVGSLAELISRIRKLLMDFSTAADVVTWAGRLTEAVELLTKVDFESQWQRNDALAKIADLASASADLQTQLDSWDIAAICDRWQADTRGRANDANGSLQVTSLDGLTGIEHRVICVLGLDDETFPGSFPVDGDDLLQRLGARRNWSDDQRARRQQQLLDSLLAASEKFIVVTRGADEQTGRLLPMPICLGALLDGISPGQDARPWGPGKDELVSWHPIHAYSRLDFDPENPFSFHSAALAGAIALQEPKSSPVNLAEAHHYESAKAAAEAEELSVNQLIKFFRNPARELLRSATGATLYEANDELATQLPIAINSLESWTVGDTIFSAITENGDPTRAAQAAWAAGLVLPDQHGQEIIANQLDKAMQIAGMVKDVAGEHRIVDCEISLAGVQLTGSIALQEDAVIISRFGSPKPETGIDAWLQLCLLSACHGAQAAKGAILIGTRPYVMQLPDPEQARNILTGLIQLRKSGMDQVLPLPMKTAGAFTRVLTYIAKDNKGEQKLLEDKFAEDSPEWRYFFPDFAALHAPRTLNSDPLLPGQKPGSRFETLSNWLLQPIKAAISSGRSL